MDECANTSQKAFSVYNDVSYFFIAGSKGRTLPLQLWLWAQEGDFFSREKKAQGGNVFRDHLQRGRLCHSYLLTC